MTLRIEFCFALLLQFEILQISRKAFQHLYDFNSHLTGLAQHFRFDPIQCSTLHFKYMYQKLGFPATRLTNYSIIQPIMFHEDYSQLIFVR